MLISTDGGKTFKEQFTPRELIIDFEVDPANPERIVASTDKGCSAPRTAEAVAADPARGRHPPRVAAGRPALRAEKDGTVEVSSDGDSFAIVGHVAGEPYELRVRVRRPVPRVKRRSDPRDDRRRRDVAGPFRP